MHGAAKNSKKKYFFKGNNNNIQKTYKKHTVDLSSTTP